MSYRHTQFGRLTIAMISTIVLLTIVVTVLVEIEPPLLILLPIGFGLFMGFLLVCFGALTVEVTSEHVIARFGPGWIRKRFELAEIESVTCVQNRWYWGWGIRLTPHGWMYNVAGLEAVELALKNGKRFRIGTDEPRDLEAAIQRASAHQA